MSFIDTNIINFPGFDGYGFIQTDNGTIKQIKDLKKNDNITLVSNKIAKVKYLIKIKINDLIYLNYINHLALYHSYNINNIIPKLSRIDYLYNIVLYDPLYNNSNIIINNIIIPTLGSELEYNSNNQNYYYTKKIIEDLEKYDRSIDGLIELNNPKEKFINNQIYELSND